MEQTGWKLVHGDVFRPPRHSFWLAVLYGTGAQLACMTGSSVVLVRSPSLLDQPFLNLASRELGNVWNAFTFQPWFFGYCCHFTLCLLRVGVISFYPRFFLTSLLEPSFSVIGGYYGGRLYKTLKGQNWTRAAMATATALPSFVFGLSFILNFFIWGKKSSGAVPFTTMIALMFLWFGISLPLVFIGYFFGFRKQVSRHRVILVLVADFGFKNLILGLRSSSHH